MRSGERPVICETATRAYPQGRTGTHAGYQAHKSVNEQPCDACRTGEADQRTDWKRTEKRTSQQRAAERAEWRKAALERDPLMDRRCNLKARFGLSLEDYDRMLAGQHGKCAVCATTEPGGRYNTFFLVDHDRTCCPGNKSCGKCVRSLLCFKCNVGLGAFDDDPDRLMAAVAYLLSRQDVLQIGRDR
jgi:hypothetical protein